jgi:HEAT repeat protein
MSDMSNISDAPRTGAGDALTVNVIASPFKFKGLDKEEELIKEAINRMGSVGDNAEAEYQASLNKLRPLAKKIVPLIAEAYQNLPEKQYIDRWSLVQLLLELREPSSLSVLDEIVSSPIPPERSKSPVGISTRGEETMIRTTAIEAIAQIAAGGDRDATEMLLKHVKDESFSVKQAAIQAYRSLGREDTQKVLLKSLPEKDHPLLSIQRKDVWEVLQPQAKEALKQRDTREMQTCPPEPTMGKRMESRTI